MADTQLDATLSASEPISGNLSANEGMSASLDSDEEVSGRLEVKRIRTVATMLSELEDVDIDDLQDDDILVYDSLDGKWHNEANAGGGGVWGTITGTLSDQADLQNALDDKYNRSEANVLGAKNLFKRFPVDTYTIGDVVFTQNANGSITVNGTVGSSVVTWRQNIVLKAGSYIVSGGVSSINFVGIYDYNTTQYIATSVEGSDEFTLAQDTEVGLTIRVNKNQTVNNIVFYPMLRFASDPDDTYAPYALTNKELTDAILQDASDIDAIEALIPSSASSSNKLATVDDIPSLANYVEKSSTDGLLKNDGTVDTTQYVSDVSGKADKVSSATSGDFAGLDANGNLTDSGISADIVPSGASSSNKLATANDIPSLSNYVEKSQTAGLLKNDGTVDTTQYISDISGKVDNSVVAPVENGTTASRAYAVGEHFIRDGAFCTAKAAISAGGTFTLNTNYVAGQINLKSLFEAKTLTSSYNLNNISDYGLYAWTSSNAPSNVPETGGQTMMVLRVSTTGLIQLVLAETALYTRCYFSTGWTTWRKIPSTAM